MKEEPAKARINEHFRREALLPAFLVGVMLILAAIVAIVGPWLMVDQRSAATMRTHTGGAP